MKSVFETREQYFEFIKNWKLATNDKEGPKLSFEHFIIYRMLKGKDWKVCLASTSSDNTKAAAEYIAYKKSYKYLSLWPFGAISEEQIINARANAMENI
jgi:hypothetical protein